MQQLEPKQLIQWVPDPVSLDPRSTPPRSDALFVPDDQLVKTILVFCQWDLSQSPDHCSLDIFKCLKSVTSDFSLQEGERPVVARRQIRAVLRVRPEVFSHVHLEKIVCCLEGSVWRGIVLQEHKIPGSPEGGAFSAQTLSHHSQ